MTVRDKQDRMQVHEKMNQIDVPQLQCVGYCQKQSMDPLRLWRQEILRNKALGIAPLWQAQIINNLFSNQPTAISAMSSNQAPKYRKAGRDSAHL